MTAASETTRATARRRRARSAAITLLHTVGRFDTRPSLQRASPAAHAPSCERTHVSSRAISVPTIAVSHAPAEARPTCRFRLRDAATARACGRRREPRQRCWVECSAPKPIEEQRHVAVHPPFAAGLAAAQRREGVGQIGVACEHAVARFDGLVQIDAVVERLEQRLLGSAADARRASGPSSAGSWRSRMPAASERRRSRPDPRIRRRHDRRRGRHRDGGAARRAPSAPTMPVSDGNSRRGCRRKQMRIEEGDRLLGRLEKAAGLGLESEHDLLARRAREVVQVCGVPHHRVGHAR